MGAKEKQSRIRQFKPADEEDIGNSIFVQCDPYIILGHVKVKSVTKVGDLILVRPQTSLDTVLTNLPVSEKIRGAFMKPGESGVTVDKKSNEKYLAFSNSARIRIGSYIFLTICSFTVEDVVQADGEFISWTLDTELLKNAGKPVVLAYISSNNLALTADLKRALQNVSEKGLTHMCSMDAQRRRAILPLLNDPKTFAPFTGNGYVLGKTSDGSGKSVTSRNKSTRRFHAELMRYRQKMEAQWKRSKRR